MPKHHKRSRHHKHGDRRSASESSADSSSRRRRRRSDSTVQSLDRFTEAMTRFLESTTNRQPSMPFRGDTVPIFNPSDRNQSAEVWCKKIDELRELYRWDEDTTIYYALSKLSGFAEIWYRGLGSLKHSWEEWKAKLCEAFPPKLNYFNLLTEMMRRTKRTNESYTEYFHEKMVLLNACDIRGTRAVDCILGGIQDRIIVSSAKVGKFQTPEALYQHFGSMENDDKPATVPYRDNQRGSFGQVIKQKRHDNRRQPNESGVVCYRCNKTGHYANACKENAAAGPSDKRCNICRVRGHDEKNCFRKGVEGQRRVALLKVVDEDPVNQKYFKKAQINDIPSEAYIDFGSSCSIIKYDEAKKFGLIIQKEETMLRGYGNGKALSMGSVTFRLKIDEVTATIKSLVVNDDEQDIPLLVGRNFTELPMVLVKKDKDTLTFYNNDDEEENQIVNVEDKAPTCKIPLIVQQDTIIPPNHQCFVGVKAKNGYVGDVYIEGNLRMQEGKESCVPHAVLRINEDRVTYVPVINFSEQDIVLKAKKVVARCWPCVEEIEPKEKLLRVDVEQLPPLDRENIIIGPISWEQKEIVFNLLQEYRDCIAENVDELGCVTSAQMDIKLKDDTPFYYRPYRVAKTEQDKIMEIVNELLESNIIRESSSEYSSPVLLVRKKNGEQRMCIDYRKLNSLTIQDRYPLPRIDDQIDRLRGGKYFTSLDLKSGYYQIPMNNEAKKYTAFSTYAGLYEFNRMPFGLTNAPRCFQRFMNRVLGPVNNIAAVYLDDVLLHAKTVEDALEGLRKVLQIFREQNLTLNLKKCSFLSTSVEFLGFEIEKDAVRPGKDKIKAVKDFPVPTTVKNIRQFLGLTGYFRQFVKNYAAITKPLTRLIKKSTTWSWKEDEDSAFKKLKEILMSRPVLALYNPNTITEVHTDASSVGMAGILLQIQDDQKLHPVAYFSRQTTDAEAKYHSYELETLAVVETLKKFRAYLIGINFTLVTDCNAIKATKEKKNLIPRIARWWLQIQEYTFEVRYRPGDRMKHVDALSRNVGSSHDGECVIRITQDDWVLAGQLTDSKIKVIRDILKRPPVTDYEKGIYKDYALRNGRVYRITARGIQWVVPRGMRHHVVRAAHDEMGHFAIEKTLFRLCEHYWFPKMREYVEKYVSCCIQCLFNKKSSGKKEGFLHPIPKGSEPMKTIHIDHLGPFPKSRRGNLILIVAVDSFTKFLFLRAVKSTKTKYVLEFLKDIFSTYGAPQMIISDQGSSFTAKKFAMFCQQNAIRHIKNAVATPRANGQVERLNRSILNVLLTTTLEEELWDENVKKVQFAINNVQNKTTGRTPSELLFGYKPRGGSDILLKDEVELTSGVLANLLEEREKVAEHVSKQQESQKRQFDRRRKKPRKYKVGDLIVLEKIEPAASTSRKLVSPYSGPFVVSSILPNDRYVVADMDGTQRTRNKSRYSRTVAVDRMKPWVPLDELSETSSSEEEPVEDGIVLSDPDNQPEAD